VGPEGFDPPHQGIMSHIFRVLHGLAQRSISTHNMIYINRYNQ